MSRHKSYVTMHSIFYVSLCKRSCLRLRPPVLRGRTYSRYAEVPFNTIMY
jgi:hypothetical protein